MIPDDARGLIEIVDNWADNTFFLPILFLAIPDLLDAAGDAKLKANREKLIGMTTAQMRERHAPMKEQLAAHLRMIDEQLAGKDFFLGKNFTMADASLYHPLFFSRSTRRISRRWKISQTSFDGTNGFAISRRRKF